MSRNWIKAVMLGAMVLVFSLAMVFSGCGEIEPIDELPQEPIDEPIPEDPGGGL
ncbi:MAG: hypothetical protein ACQEP5_06990 [Actinomycetota bacterium]